MRLLAGEHATAIAWSTGESTCAQSYRPPPRKLQKTHGQAEPWAVAERDMVERGKSGCHSFAFDVDSVNFTRISLASQSDFRPRSALDEEQATAICLLSWPHEDYRPSQGFTFLNPQRSKTF